MNKKAFDDSARAALFERIRQAEAGLAALK